MVQVWLLQSQPLAVANWRAASFCEWRSDVNDPHMSSSFRRNSTYPSFLVVGTSCLIVLTTSPAFETEEGQRAELKERDFPSCRGREGFTLVTAYRELPSSRFPLYSVSGRPPDQSSRSKPLNR